MALNLASIRPVSSDELAPTTRGAKAAPIAKVWYDVFDIVKKEKGSYIPLPVSDEQVKSTANVRTIMTRIAAEKNVPMSKKGKNRKGSYVLQVVSRVYDGKQYHSTRTVDNDSGPKERETHAFVGLILAD